MGFFTTKDGSVYRRWVNIIPSALISGGGHFLAGRKRAGVVWFLIIFCACLISYFLFLSQLNKSYALLLTFTVITVILSIVMLIDACRTPIPRLKLRTWAIYVLAAIAISNVPSLIIHQFFFQPFRMPTGSMEPTLYGVTSTPDLSAVTIEAENAEAFGTLDDNQKAGLQAAADAQLKLQRSITVPTGWERVKEWFAGYSYVHVVAQNDGELEAVNPPVKFLIFNIKQTLVIGDVAYTIWFPPDYGEVPLEFRAGLKIESGRVYHKGDDVVKIRVHAGDHLFVDRFTYNFRKPAHGDLVVFSTTGIQYPQIAPGFLWVKRIVGIPGDTVSIHAPNVLINGKILDEPPIFKEIASGANGYSGYTNAQLLATDKDKIVLGKDEYLVFGDNSQNSLDGRYFGAIKRSNIKGKVVWIYWPFERKGRPQ
jgi:signal peptidase I